MSPRYEGLNDLDTLYFDGKLSEVAKAVAAFPGVYNLTKRKLYQKVLDDLKNGVVPDINPDLYEAYSQNFRKAVAGVFGDNPSDLSIQFDANVSRFAAHKAYHATRELAGIEADEIDTKGKAILNKYNRWQAAEYNTAVARARTARQWKDLQEDTTLYPNLRWLPSRSATPREQHMVFYNRVWAKTDPFWNENTPGSLWNCKCDWEETDEPVTDGNPVTKVTAKGLEGNPGITGEIFTNESAYIKKAGRIVLDRETAGRYPSLQKLLDYDNSKWRADYYDDQGGLLLTNRIRIKEGLLNGNEEDKFNKEHNMCQTLAFNHHIVEYRQSVEGSFDIFIDGKKADLKKTKGTSNIHKYALKAVHRQGAELVVFEFNMENSINVQREIIALKQKGISGYYFFTGKKNKLYTI